MKNHMIISVVLLIAALASGCTDLVRVRDVTWNDFVNDHIKAPVQPIVDRIGTPSP